MSSKLFRILAALLKLNFVMLVLLTSSKVTAQKEDKIELVKADIFEGGKYNGTNVYKFKGDVIFRQKGMMVYCDSAYQYSKKNGSLEAFGHVRIVQGDSLTITGNTLHYEPDTKNADLKGNVVFTEKETTLRTEALSYNTGSKIAIYTTGGTIRDAKSTLTSTYGRYESEKKFFYFRNKVKVLGPDGTLVTDTLDYNTNTKIAYFFGPSELLSIDGVVHANRGEYQTGNKGESITKFTGKARVESGSYIITGDQMYNDEKRRVSVIRNNVKVTSLKDSIIIEGDIAYYWGSKGMSKIFGNALMKNFAEKDTLYLTADTLLSLDNNIASEKRLLAYNHSRIYRKDLQGKCDSLVYNFADSAINFYHDPVLWNEGSQILADTIKILLANKKIDRMNMNVNSFIISTDSLDNYNQVKGKKMVAYFKENKIEKVNVSGNGESIYFALEGDSLLVGMNKVICSDMLIKFKENKANSITFISNPDASFIPPHELVEPERKLKGFRWRIKERPTIEEVQARRAEKKKIRH